MAARTAVFYLDVDDEITSAASRIRGSKATRVAIVVPPGSRIATSRINFRLLAREALERNRRLSIVAPDAASRALAASAGLPVFLSVGEFESAEAEQVGRDDGSSGDGDGPAAAIGILPTAPVADAASRARSRPRPERDAGEETIFEQPSNGSDRSRGERRTAGAFAGGATTGAASTATAAGAGAASTATRASPGTPAGTTTARAPTTIRSRLGGGLPVIGPGQLQLSRDRLAVAGVIVALVLLVLAVVGYLVLPSATVVIRPRIDTIGPFNLTVRADPTATGVDAANGVIPAQRVTLPVSVTDTFPATGHRTAQTKSTGTVTFQNCDTGRQHTIPAGADVSTDAGIDFATTKSVTLDRATVGGFPFQTLTCTTGDAPVAAAAAGPEANVPAGAIDHMPPGYDASVLKVANADPTTGGTRQQFPKIVQKDVDSAVAALTSRLTSQFNTLVTDPSQAPQGMTVFPGTASVGTVTPTSDPKALVNQEQPSFQLTMTANGTALAVDETPLRELATAKLHSSVAADHDLVANSLDVSIGTPSATVDGVTFPISVSAKEVQRLDPDDVRAEIKGKSLAEARSVLAEYGDADLSTWPDWVSSVPTLDWRLNVHVESTVPIESSAPSEPSASAESSAPASAGASAAPSVGSPSSSAAASPSSSAATSAADSAAPSSSTGP